MKKSFTKVKCRLCEQTGGISAAKVHRLSGPAVVIGYIFLVPSFLWMMFFGLTAVLALAGESSGKGLAFAMCLALLLPGFVGGLVGWLLIMKKDVLRCGHCGGIHGNLA